MHPLVSSGQVARQGRVDADGDVNAFHSPMVLEASFVAASRSIWGKKGWFEGPDYIGLSKYSCDGVFLRGDVDGKTHEPTTGIAMHARELKGGQLEVTVGLSFLNPSHNHDKLVTVFLEIIDASHKVVETTFGPISVEDKGHAQHFSFPIVMPVSAVKDDGSMKMRLTVSTRDD
jgi:hypothetical protein